MYIIYIYISIYTPDDDDDLVIVRTIRTPFELEPDSKLMSFLCNPYIHPRVMT